MQLREIKNIFHKELDYSYQKEEVDSFFYLLIEQHLGFERFVLPLQPQLTITKEQEQPLFVALNRLRLNQPIQHIIGKAFFMDMEFSVNPDVLIPRPETEELIRWILDCQDGSNGDLKILDIGTGSGCIAVSLAKKMPNARVYALDISEKALEIAKQNAVANDAGVTFFCEDVLQLESLGVWFDLIVSNPPYVRESEQKDMHKNVLEYEPGRALFVSDEDPLKFYRAIIDFSMKNLNDGGSLFFEINQYLGKETQQLLQDHNFLEIELRKDMFGNDRMLKGIFKVTTDLK